MFQATVFKNTTNISARLLLRVYQRSNMVNILNNVAPNQCALNFSSNVNDSDDNDDKRNKSGTSKSQEALKKLNQLLHQMVQEDVAVKKSLIDLAKPKSKRGQSSDEIVHTESVEKQMVNAVKDVAKEIGGNVNETESELLMKLLSSKTETSAKSSDLSEIVKGMKIDRETKATGSQSRAQQVREILQQSKFRQGQTSEAPRKYARAQTRLQQGPEPIKEKIDIFGSEPLGIFKEATSVDDVSKPNKIWEDLYSKELKLAVTHPPANYFQQMILWTEQGKLWRFPIDNEQGMEKEQNVYFAEHIFLEKHLEGWCPSRGPVRHFMELVCVGLSKNPYLSVEAKKEHIAWYRDYFEDKKKLLHELGAISESSPKQPTLPVDN